MWATASCARALQVGDQISRNLACDLGPQIFGDEGQREVERGGDSRRGEHRPVPDIDRVGVDGDPGMAAGQHLGEGPMRGRPPTVEQARRGQHRGSGADRGDPPGQRCQPPHMRHQDRIRRRRGRLETAETTSVSTGTVELRMWCEDDRARPQDYEQDPAGPQTVTIVECERSDDRSWPPSPAGRHTR